MLNNPHKGTIAVYSASGDRDTEFTIEPPYIAKEVKKATATEEDTGTEIDRDYSHTDSDRPRILIVEDEVDSASLLQLFLINEGYQAEIAFNGIDAVTLARQFSPDVILSDIGLTPEMDGYTLARIIRDDANLNSIYMIAISGFGQPEDKKNAFAAGFNAHLTKPLDLETVQKAIDDITFKKTN